MIESTDSANLRTCSTCCPPFIRRIGCFFCVTPRLTDLRTVTCLVWIILKWMIKSVNEHITIFPWWLIGYEATVHWIKINRWLFFLLCSIPSYQNECSSSSSWHLILLQWTIPYILFPNARSHDHMSFTVFLSMC